MSANYIDRLLKYTRKHGYTLVETYVTCGESGNHYRAKVKDVEGKIYYLYYDRSKKRTRKICPVCGNTGQQHIYDGFSCGTYVFFTERGWRNVTLDNLRKKERRNA